MRRFQTAEQATVLEKATKKPFSPIICPALYLESLCMSMPRSKGLSCLVDEKMSSSSDIRSSKKIFSGLHRLTWCIQSEYKPSFFLPSRQ